jgi:ATP phosphoribosyltransferase
MLRLAVPSDGALHEPSLLFLDSCGMGVSRTNLRRYTAEIPSMPGVAVHFQRGSDVAFKVEEGSADIGVVGHDRFLETYTESGSARIVVGKLGFGRSELVMGVPDSWVDVTSVADLADLSIEFRERGADLRVATKYPRLVVRFLMNSGVNYFSLVQSSGTLEAAPAMGYADIIADISSTGTTLRENRLKTIDGGSVMASEACLIANGTAIAADPGKLSLAQAFVERVEAHLQSRGFFSVTANMSGEDPDEIAACVLEHSDISGLRGPTISKVYSRDGEGWYAVTVIVEKDKLLDAVERFRQIGGSSVTVSQPDYVFQPKSDAAKRLTSTE